MSTTQLKKKKTYKSITGLSICYSLSNEKESTAKLLYIKIYINQNIHFLLVSYAESDKISRNVNIINCCMRKIIIWLLDWYMWIYFVKTPLLLPDIILKYMYKCLNIFYLCVDVCVGVHMCGGVEFHQQLWS